MSTEFPNHSGNDDDSDNNQQFDPDQLRLSQDFGAIIGGRRILTTIPVGKPSSQVFIRIHPDEEYHLTTALLLMKEDGEQYLVDRRLWDELSNEIVPKVIYTGITRQGNLFLWPLKLPGMDGKLDTWNQAAHEIAAKAKTCWVRVTSNRQISAYEYVTPSAPFPDPEWPPILFKEILTLAFKDKFIRDPMHPVLRKLRGEI